MLGGGAGISATTGAGAGSTGGGVVTAVGGSNDGGTHLIIMSET
jgi:hypothetical protein